MINPSSQEPRAETATAAVRECASPSEQSPVLLTSREVLRGQKAVVITHNGSLYRLQTTRQGKLILTK